MFLTFKRLAIHPTVLVAALGYFVDMFDLTLFGVVRVASLKGIGVSDPTELLKQGVYLLNSQMLGMVIGGICWGIIGDKRGRLSVLFGSILLYSAANIANAFIWDLPSYAVVRFLAGFGLAGELGAAITLVSEVLSKEDRGYGTTIVATLGLLGAVTAALIGQLLPWQWAYIIGGLMGLMLLAARAHVFESGMFDKVKSQNKTGNFLLFFSRKRFPKYIGCILIAVPIWFITGVLMTFAPELTKDLNFTGPISAGNALLFCSIGLTIGDLASGLLGQILKSRRQSLAIFLASAALLSFLYSRFYGASPTQFYVLCFALGTSAGYWAVFVTVAAEQFGTNLRATVATTAPNFVRASVILISLSFLSLKTMYSTMQSAFIIGIVLFTVASISLYLLPETYGKDLDYLES